MLGVEFKVIAITSNTNSFGLRQCVLVAKNGLAYKACANSINMPKQGSVITIPYQGGSGDIGDAPITLSFAHKGFEIPERIEDAPREVIDEFWN